MYKSNKVLLSAAAASLMVASFGTSVFANDDSDTTDVDVGVSGGVLNLTVPQPDGFTEITLGTDPEIHNTGFTDPVFVEDARGTQEGWRLEVSATQMTMVEPDGYGGVFTDHALPQGSLIAGQAESIDPAEPYAFDLPAIQNTDNTPIDEGDNLTLVSAAADTGMGAYDIFLGNDFLGLNVDPVNVAIDNDAYPDGPTIYESTITWNLVSGP